MEEGGGEGEGAKQLPPNHNQLVRVACLICRVAVFDRLGCRGRVLHDRRDRCDEHLVSDTECNALAVVTVRSPVFFRFSSD